MGPLDEPSVQKFLRALVRSALYQVFRRELRWGPRELGFGKITWFLMMEICFLVVNATVGTSWAVGSAVVTAIVGPAEATFVTAPGLQPVSVVLPAPLACPAAQVLSSLQPPVEAA